MPSRSLPSAAEGDASGRTASIDSFLQRYGIRALAQRVEEAHGGEPDLENLLLAFGRLPYENLTKILRFDEAGAPSRAKRTTEQVFEDHLRLGTGGTCFSLTNAFLDALGRCGQRAEPILADRPYGENTHCALLLWLAGAPHLVDPGYLLVRPVPVPEPGAEASVSTSFNEVVLRRSDDGSRLELATVQEGRRVHRLSFRLEPAAPPEFHAAWDASFGWEMMRYPLLSSASSSGQIYVQGNYFQRRSRDGVQRIELAPDAAAARIGKEFGIAPALVDRTLSLLASRGEGP